MNWQPYNKHGITGSDPVITEDQALIYIGTPDRSTCPYDTYARIIENRARIAFMRAGIEATVVSCHRRIAHVGFGSGPGGARRFGDDMIPPDVQAIVRKEDAERASQAYEDFTGRWMLRKPFSVYGSRWYDKDANAPGHGAWVTGGAWTRVIVNAIAIAVALRKDTTKLKAYLLRRPDTKITERTVIR